MAFYYFTWKNGIKVENKELQEWTEITEKQYLQICETNKTLSLDNRRLFEKVPGVEQGDDTYYFECDLDDYRKYRRKKEKEAYKEKEETKDTELFGEITLISLDAPYEDSNGEAYSLHDLVADKNSLFEDELIQSLDLYAELDALPEDERKLIDAIYLSDEPLNDREYAKQIGIPRKTINNRKIKILRNLKKSLAKS